MNDFDLEYDEQAKLIYSIIVAGKSANFADKATKAFLLNLAKATACEFLKVLPCDMLRELEVADIKTCAVLAHTGNYNKLAGACKELASRINGGFLDLRTCKPSDLEKIKGIGYKTSRFFIMWIRPHEEYAALDVHVLRWMRNNGYPNAPKSTPSNIEVYLRYERDFIFEAKRRGKTARQFDSEIWESGARRAKII